MTWIKVNANTVLRCKKEVYYLSEKVTEVERETQVE